MLVRVWPLNLSGDVLITCMSCTAGPASPLEERATTRGPRLSTRVLASHKVLLCNASIPYGSMLAGTMATRRNNHSGLGAVEKREYQSGSRSCPREALLCAGSR